MSANDNDRKTPLDAVATIAGRLPKDIAELTLLTLQGEPLNITIPVGCGGVSSSA